MTFVQGFLSVFINVTVAVVVLRSTIEKYLALLSVGQHRDCSRYITCLSFTRAWDTFRSFMQLCDYDAYLFIWLFVIRAKTMNTKPRFPLGTFKQAVITMTLSLSAFNVTSANRTCC